MIHGTNTKNSIRRRIWKITAWSAGVLGTLLLVLVVHLYMVIPREKTQQNNRQLSRIDFKQTVDSGQAGQIRGFVASLPGIESTLFNVPDGILVYTYDPEKQNSENVYEQVMKVGDYKAVKYAVAKAETQRGCPAGMENNSFTSTLAKYVNQLFQ